ncbi:protein Eaa [Salmonella enterica]|nr:protein Eaa [Salmonella enterica]
MSTITRERLLKIQQWSETYGAGSNVMLPAEEAEELARIALASLDAEPVGEVSEKRHGLVMDGTVDLGGKSTYRIIKGEKAMKRLPLGTKFYIVPPASVVPDERAAFNAWNNEDNLPIAGVGAKNAAWLAWQARASLCGNSALNVPPERPADSSNGDDIEAWFDEGWNACRSAMLNGGKS